MVKHKAKVSNESCLACCGCISICPNDAISWINGKAFIDSKRCTGCSICIRACPVGAIEEVILSEV